MRLFIAFTVGLAAALYAAVSSANVDNGIYPLGRNGQGVLICEEAITINAWDLVTDKQAYEMLDEALLIREESCHDY